MKLSIAALNDEIVSLVEFHLDVGLDQMSSPFVGSLLNRLAVILEIPLEDIHLLGFRPGADLLVAFTRFAISLPDTLGEQLMYYQLRSFTPWMRLPKVLTFITHNELDARAATAIQEYLLAERLNSWLDRENFLPGERRLAALLRNLKDATSFVYCLSRNSIQPGRSLMSQVQEAEREANLPVGECTFKMVARLEECELPTHFIKYPFVDWGEGANKQKLSALLKGTQGGIPRI